MNRHAISSGAIDGHESIALRSAAADLTATYVPKVGMVCCSLQHRGDELLGQRNGLAAYARDKSTMGIPFLYPWANRLSGLEYEAGGRRVELDPRSPLLHLDGNGLPIHGLLAASPYWEVRDASADDSGARLTAELDFGAHDDLLACFPFPHVVRLDVLLRDNALTITTTVAPTADIAVPLCFGFHPYLTLPGKQRAEWVVELPVATRLELDDRMIPTGATESVDFPTAPLGDRDFDDAYEAPPAGSHFAVSDGERRIEVAFIEGFPYAQLYSPRDSDFICFEPMAAPTNALVTGSPPAASVADGARAALAIVLV